MHPALHVLRRAATGFEGILKMIEQRSFPEIQ
jgi:hypothetical protein